MDSIALIQALYTLKPGHSIIYFVGFLDSERYTNAGALKAASVAGELARKGRIHLTQRRLGLPTKEGEVDWRAGVGPGFEYIATGALKEEKWFD